ncbi:aminotransferase class V-fold PLP-dependent enzyme [Phycisphaerales bacterium AB-hyl4]|uniref:Aminotransferase class V-fold PLP-dependent enzyme n=1 Tax=Natronomicrosphaera hydrolytica TaxID=3242702 RepID=A0ABV4U6X9_9BACT
MSHDSSQLAACPGSDVFPILDEMAFFNHAGVAPISGPAADALAQYAARAASHAYVDSGWYRRVREVKRAAATLINARGEHEIAFVPNTTAGLAQVVYGLNWQRGDNVVITNVEYPANRYPWQDIQQRLGVDLIEVPQQPDGRIDVDDVLDAITDRTRVVSLSHVQFASGHRIDLKPISDTLHQLPSGRGYLCVDAIQSVGVLPVDVQAMGIDFLSADGHKWMLGPEGCGIFYCHEDLAPLLRPTIVGWMCMVDAQNFGDYRFELLPDARRFEPGSYNIPGIYALGASIDLLLETGIDKVWARIESLTARLCERLPEKGYRVFSPRDHADERSGIVIFEPTDDAKPPLPQIVTQLQQQGIVIALREGRLRASPHYYNRLEQIDRLIDALP